MGDVNHEPTMEEILASIKKIIAEDGDAPVDAPDVHQNRVRSEPAPEPEPEPAPEPEEPVAEAEEEDVLELTDQLSAADDEQGVPSEPEAAEAIASDETVEASKAALAALSAIAANPIPKSGDALDTHPLEGLVREMLRPMLREWLDENLPSMVEEMVAREIARIAAGGK
jgi:cell pole-organizing protein PopZ